MPRTSSLVLLLASLAVAEPLLVVDEGHRSAVSAAAFRPDGKVVATGGYDGLVKLWSVETGRLLLTLPPPHGRITGLAWTPDGSRLVVGQVNAEVRVWDVSKVELVQDHDFDQGGYCGVAVSPDGKWFAYGADGWCGVRAVADGAERYRFKGPERDRFWSVAFSLDGTHLAAAGDTFVYFWRLSDGELVRRLEGFPRYVMQVAFGEEGLVTRVREGPVEVWDWPTGRRLRKVADVAEEAAVDGSTIVYANAEGTLSLGVRGEPGALAAHGGLLLAGTTLWDVGSKRKLRELAATVRASARKVEGTRLAISEGERIRVWDFVERETVRVVEGGKSVAFSPGGTHLAVDGRITDLATGETRAVEAAIRGPSALGPGGTPLAWRQSADVIRMEGGRTFPGNEYTDVLGLAFSPDGKLLLQSGKGEFFAAYDVASGERVRVNESGVGWIVSLALSADGKTLLCGGPYSSVTVRDPAYKRLRTLDGHRGSVLGVTFLPGEKRIASVGAEGDLRMWDAATGECLLTLRVLGDGEWIATAPDGRYEASAKAGERCGWARPGLERVPLDAVEPTPGLVVASVAPSSGSK